MKVTIEPIELSAHGIAALCNCKSTSQPTTGQYKANYSIGLMVSKASKIDINTKKYSLLAYFPYFEKMK
jgi:hypothetical protein